MVSDAHGADNGTDPSHGTHRVHHDETENVELSTTIVSAVATAANLSPEAINLDAVVHPDCLNMLFGDRDDGRPRAGGELSFELAGRSVVVHGDGEVVVESTDDESPYRISRTLS